MTVKMLTAWNGYPKDYIGSVISPSEEARLVGIGFASYDLDGVDNDNVRTPVTAATNPLTGRIRILGGPELPTDPESQALLNIATSSQKTKLYKSANGIPAVVSAVIAGVAVETGSASIATIDGSGIPRVYSDGAWAVGAGTGVASATRMMFVTSAGVVFAAPGGSGKLFRSANSGLTYSQVATFTYADEDTMSMTEDDQGTLWTHSYAHATKSVSLLKSTDGGGTWVDLADVVHVYSSGSDSGTMRSVVNRHIHEVYWCPHRKFLFVTHGDAGSKSPVLISEDRGATFHVWGSLVLANNFAGSVQATTLLSDVSNIYYRADLGVGSSNQDYDFGIYVTAHSSADTLASLLASTPTKRWSETRKNGFPVEGWSSNGGITRDGIVWFNTNSSLNYSGKVIASADFGRTWETAFETAEATGGSYGSFSAGRGYRSAYAPATSNALFYGNTSDEPALLAFKVLPVNRKVHAYEGELSAQWLPSPAQVSKVYTDFETLPAPSSTGGDTGTAPNMASTGPTAGPFLGTKCAKFTFNGTGLYSEAKWNNVFNGYAAGSDLIIDSRVYVDSASLAGNLGSLNVFSGDGYIYIGCAATGQIKATTAGVLSWSATAAPSEKKLPLNRWFWLRTVVTRHPTKGAVTVLIDGQVALRVIGIPTTGADMYTAEIGGNLGGGWVGNVYFDNLAISVTPAASIPTRIEAGGEF